jgi:hypothetical protein
LAKPALKGRGSASDNLNIHSKASLYEAFPPVEARRLVERFEWHYSPKHCSCLDLAKSEIGVPAWEHDRNTRHEKPRNFENRRRVRLRS